MDDQSKSSLRPIFCRDASWEAFPRRTQPPRVSGRDFGVPSFLEPDDLEWITWARKRLAASSWLGQRQALPLPLFGGRPPAASDQQTPRKATGGVSEIRTGPDSWSVRLDVNHFSPEDITITTKEGFLQISGNREDKRDESGSVSRCFTQKYKLPPGVDSQHISSSLSPDGVLSVEAPVRGTPVGGHAGEIVIPVQTRRKQEGEK